MAFARTYWLDLFSYSTWVQFQEASCEISGFRERRWKMVQKMRPGDYLLCYLTGVSRWIGLLEVVSEPFFDRNPLWIEDDFPARVKVKPLVSLTPETAVPVFELREKLSVFKNLNNPNAWTGYFRGSPAKWKIADGETVAEALLAANANPVTRPVDEKKLGRMPPVLKAKTGVVTVPEDENGTDDNTRVGAKVGANTQREPTVHTEIQWLLLKLGNEMGLDVWVARNDRNREYDGHRFDILSRLRKELPHQFDDATNRTIELIDVLWLQGNAIVAAFEIESTTSIYSGLLRMSDLVTMQPNLKIPLYLVAPDERRNKVIEEINRPTFSRLKPPLSEICRFIPFSGLREKIAQVESLLHYLKPDFIQEVSESCAVDDT